MTRSSPRLAVQLAIRLLRGPLVLALAAAACATPTVLSSYQRSQVELRYKGQPRELKSSMYVAPFFRDASRRLLSLDPPGEVELLVTPEGKPIPPGDALEVLPAGTRVTVLDVAFPTRWSTLTRPLMTPRDRPWLELAVEGRPTSPAYVIPLRPDVKSDDDVAAELDKILSKEDVAARVKALPPPDQLAVRTKQLAVGLSTQALELAFGTPALRKIYGQGSSVAEDWTWKSDAGVVRSAHVKDGQVVSVELPPAKVAASK